MNKIQKLYSDLRKKHGPPQGQWRFDKPSATLSPSKGWSLWAKRPKTLREKERVLIEAILTQITNWRNVKLAMDNLKEAKADSLGGISRFNQGKLGKLIRPAGFYKQKSDYLLRLTKFVLRKGGIRKLEKMPLVDLRRELLDLKGVGRETADSILLYALEKPVFVIDEYTKRLLRSKLKVTLPGIRRGRKQMLNYEELRKLFEDNLPRDWRLYQDFHALIVINGKLDR